MNVFLPHSGSYYRNTSCICQQDKCRLVQTRFKKINDARGGFFAIPDTQQQQRHQNAKQRAILEAFRLEDLPKRSYVAVHHFAPSVLRDRCMRKKGKQHIYCWPSARKGNDGQLDVVPTYPINSALADCKKTEEAIARTPNYSHKSRANTEYIATLLLSDRKSLSSKEKKKIYDYCYFVRKQKQRQRLLPLEKEARLEQIGLELLDLSPSQQQSPPAPSIPTPCVDKHSSHTII